MVLDKPLNEISEDDLNLLITEKVSEGKYIDYKSDIVSSRSKDKKEFLADITSFANASGGYLLIGIVAKNGVPTEIKGIEGFNPDHEKLHMENLIRTSIEPRIPNIQIHTLELNNKNIVFIIKIPKSWSSPHVVNHEKHWRFYSRNSAGKYPLDVAEVKSAFILSESLHEKIQTFRYNRLNKIIANDLSAKLSGEPIIVLHLLPFESFDPLREINFSLKSIQRLNIRPLFSSSYNDKFNFYGYLKYAVDHNKPGHCTSYAQLYKNGCIESAASTNSDYNKQNQTPISIISFEENIIQYTTIYLETLKSINISPPIVIVLTMFGVRNQKVYYSRDHRNYDYNIEEDNLIFDPVVLYSYEEDISILLKPIFDSLWNSFGAVGSLNYDNNGMIIMV